MIAGFWFVLSCLAITAWYCAIVILASLAGVRRRPDGVFDRAGRGWGRNNLRANRLTVSVTGAENIPRGPVVFVANHVSFVDIWVLVALLPGTVRFLAKRELLHVPVFGWAMRSAGHIPIDRKNRQAAVDACGEAGTQIRNGTSAIVFGEGTRSRTGELLPLKKGAFVLAIQAGVPVVPVYLEGTYAVLPKGTLALKRRPIEMRIGQPIGTAGLTYADRDALSVRCREALISLRNHVDGPVLAG
jgi:1-acyl-sn-glycerol-3-phosphate acyltransferase